MLHTLQLSGAAALSCAERAGAPAQAPLSASRDGWRDRLSAVLLPGLCSLDCAGVSGFRMCMLSMKSGLLGLRLRSGSA